MASGPEHYAAAEECLANAAEYRAAGDDEAAQYTMLQASIHGMLAMAAAQLAGRNSIPRQWGEVLES